MDQIYKNYTEEDQKVWKILFDRQYANLGSAATTEFFRGLERIEFSSERIPNFVETNQILGGITGWRLQAVPGIVDDDEFFQLLSEKRFPATTWLRKMSQLDYLEEPDMFHDVFAHVPLLSNQHYVDFLKSLSEMAIEHINNPWAVHLLSRIYWFTIEFGLIRENGELKIYGAGILSSTGETQYSISNEPEHIDYNVESMFNTPYRKDIFQPRYYVIESYEQLYSSIPEIKSVLGTLLKKELIQGSD